ncbi:MAG: hypothetical protein WCR02_06895 [Sphaerochaetaceae bacterium]
MDAFSHRIASGSTLVHDKEKSHQQLVREMNLTREVYDSREIKKLDDSDNTLGKVNNLCRLLQLFLRTHPGFMRSEIQNYLNIFSMIMNQLENKYEKVEKLPFRVMCFLILLRYRR